MVSFVLNVAWPFLLVVSYRVLANVYSPIIVFKSFVGASGDSVV